MTPEEKTKLSNKIDVLNKLLASTNNKDDEFMYNYFIKKYTRQLQEKTFIGDLPLKEREIAYKKKHNQYNKKYRDNNKEKIKEYHKEYKKNNKEKSNEYQRNLYHYKNSWGGNPRYNNNNLLQIDINLFQ